MKFPGAPPTPHVHAHVEFHRFGGFLSEPFAKSANFPQIFAKSVKTEVFSRRLTRPMVGLVGVDERLLEYLHPGGCDHRFSVDQLLEAHAAPPTSSAAMVAAAALDRNTAAPASLS